LSRTGERHDRTGNDRRYTVYLIGTCLVVLVSAAFGQWLTMFLQRIPPGLALEEIATSRRAWRS
jgi:hypothetical protein